MIQFEGQTDIQQNMRKGNLTNRYEEKFNAGICVEPWVTGVEMNQGHMGLLDCLQPFGPIH